MEGNIVSAYKKQLCEVFDVFGQFLYIFVVILFAIIIIKNSSGGVLVV